MRSLNQETAVVVKLKPRRSRCLCFAKGSRVPTPVVGTGASQFFWRPLSPIKGRGGTRARGTTSPARGAPVGAPRSADTSARTNSPSLRPSRSGRNALQELQHLGLAEVHARHLDLNGVRCQLHHLIVAKMGPGAIWAHLTYNTPRLGDARFS